MGNSGAKHPTRYGFKYPPDLAASPGHTSFVPRGTSSLRKSRAAPPAGTQPRVSGGPGSGGFARREALVIVEPRTAISWQRRRFQEHWERVGQRC